MTRSDALFFVLAFCLLGSFAEGWRCHAQPAQASSRSETQAIGEKLEQLNTTLQATQAQMDLLREQIGDLRRELLAASAARTPATAASAQVGPPQPAPAATRLEEDEQIVAAEVKQHEQTKVGSGSKFPLQITGLLLFNAFSNAGVVDQVDLPTSALRRSAGLSHGSVGGSLRQTWLGLESRGPQLGRYRTSASLTMDFFGGTTDYLTSGPAGVMRLRTGGIRAATDATLFEARFDEPLISPLSPTSLANVAQPALAWTGNLWTWAPELRWMHEFSMGSSQSLNLEAGLRDPYLANGAPAGSAEAASPAESSRRPAYEARVSYGAANRTSATLSSLYEGSTQSWRVGGGAYYAQQNYGNSTRINTWAITADWALPVRRWLNLSGELYKGTGLGGLGGGAYRDAVQGTDPLTGQTRTIGLDGAGGWTQIQIVGSPRTQFNFAVGQDAGSGAELRLLNLPQPASPVGFYARNRAITANLLYRPWNSLVISPEFRHVTSWPISGMPNVADIFTVSAGYQF